MLANNIQKKKTIDAIYPIGALYLSMNNTNPSTLFGGTLIYPFTYGTGANTAGELEISFPGPRFINQSYTLSVTLWYTGNNWTPSICN